MFETSNGSEGLRIIIKGIMEANQMKYKDKTTGEEIWGIKDMNTLLKRNNQLLKKYYYLAFTFVTFILCLLIYVLLMFHKYHFMSLLIDAIRGVC